MMKWILVVWTGLFASRLLSQTEGQEILSSYGCAQLGMAVRIDFEIEAGVSYCTGVDLERSTDGLNYEIIGSISGVCGGSEFEESYVLWDSIPVPHILSLYRLNLGLVGRSEPCSLNVVEFIGGLRLFPNPTSDMVTIRINNPRNSGFRTSFYSSTGSLMHETEISTGTSMIVDGTAWSPGPVHSVIRFDTGEILSGTFILLE